MNGALTLVKRTIPGHEFVDEPYFEKSLSLVDKVWIGHNRWGTIGKNIKNNAHPFWVLDDDDSWLLVGAHNGTLRNRHVLTDWDKFGTDSEALLNEIVLTDAKTTVSKLEGAWALTWACNYTDTMNFLRNKERSLYYAFTKDKKSLVWASEKWMIIVSAMKGGLELEDTQEFEEDTLYVMPIDFKDNSVLTFEKKEDYVGKQSVFFQANQNQNPPNKTWWDQDQEQKRAEQQEKQRLARVEAETRRQQHSGTPPSSTSQQGHGGSPISTNSTVLTPPETSGTNDNVLSMKQYRGFGGEKLSKRQLEDALAAGCCFCETEVIEVTDRFGWLDKGKAVCSKCLDGDYADDEYSKMFVAMEMLKKTIH